MKNVSSLKSNNTNSPKTPGGISKSLLTPCRRLGLSRNWKKSGPSPFISPLSSSSSQSVVIEDRKETRKRKARVPEANIEESVDSAIIDENEVITENINKTPSRNVELPRRKKSGPSSFISPLSSVSQSVVIEDKKETRKRKACVPEENIEESVDSANIDENEVITENINLTPSRNVELPRRKKSKTLISTINKSQEDITVHSEVLSDNYCAKEQSLEKPQSVSSHNSENIEVVSTPVQTNSKNSKKRKSPLKNIPKPNKIDPKHEPDNDSNKCKIDSEDKPAECDINSPSIEQESNKEEAIYAIKQKSPNDLRKECVVVIQRKIFKNIENKTNSEITKGNNEKPLTCDSDSDEAPLINLHRQNSTKSTTHSIIDDDNDFIDNNSIKPKQNKVVDTKSPKNKVKAKKIIKVKPENVSTEQKPPSQTSFDDEDDDFDNKKTILIRKSYEKVSKPIKAKSTGSITQRDIDNLRNRIEAKKKLLLAQSLTPDTEELRSLIKKWQKGCQDALMELLDLMRNKCQEKDRLDHSEMLKALKIPPSLVGYDSENDCFNSLDDASIILGQFKDL